MAKRLKISCKESSFLISKKQETALSFIEKVQLNLHLLICDVCKLFKKQTDYIISLLQHTATETKTLSDTSKEKMKEMLDKQMQ